MATKVITGPADFSGRQESERANYVTIPFPARIRNDFSFSAAR
jgi:hypothetical protein